MAYLFAYSAAWRSLVNATRNPKIMGVFIFGTTGAFVLAWRGSELATQNSMRTTEAELIERGKTDDEVQRLANNSERALAAMFDQFGKGRDEEKNKKLLSEQQRLKVPGVEWHPKAK